MIFAEWAILLLGSLKVRALCAIYLASQINAERRLSSIKDKCLPQSKKCSCILQIK